MKYSHQSWAFNGWQKDESSNEWNTVLPGKILWLKPCRIATGAIHMAAEAKKNFHITPAIVYRYLQKKAQTLNQYEVFLLPQLKIK